jgi:hypothetical protein
MKKDDKRSRGGPNNIRLWRLIDPAGNLVVVRNLKKHLRTLYGEKKAKSVYQNICAIKQHDYRVTADGWRLAEQRHGHRWSEASRRRKAAQPKPAALDLGTDAAQRKAHAEPERHHEADDWTVRDPEGRTHQVRNLRRWLIVRLGEDKGKRVYVGLRQVRLSLAGKTKRQVGSAHGWTIVSTSNTKVTQ